MSATIALSLRTRVGNQLEDAIGAHRQGDNGVLTIDGVSAESVRVTIPGLGLADYRGGVRGRTQEDLDPAGIIRDPGLAKETGYGDGHLVAGERRRSLTQVLRAMTVVASSDRCEPAAGAPPPPAAAPPTAGPTTGGAPPASAILLVSCCSLSW